MSKRINVGQRREIFEALVATQDRINDVPRSRELITKRFGITESQLRQIEDEGIERQWPPLEEEEETVGA
jgi:hypothetical protein